ncbi:phage head morphogenesis protein [Gallibacterium salpingitidis]|uniref:phage head morphogenesis protein n=1 Tax=Gallibacterium salpingitidis TaxID=505341 RepID=UPI00266F5095|nr:minor capsid protein [Gallibacterium salpingitidis]WKT00522.1 phage head morphogenesis protein [Gallibacterium salpingitidis]
MNWVLAMRKNPNELQGKPLKVSASISADYSKAIKRLMRSMYKDTMIGIEACFTTYAEDSLFPKNGSLVAQLKILISRLLKKYEPVFMLLAKRETDKMLIRVDKNASATLKMSLKDVSKDLSVKTDLTSSRLREVTQASTQEAVDLIKTIPTNYLSAVQKVVMHSISANGKGFAELKPFLTKLYKGNERKAELVALDQTHKAYQNIQAEKMKKLGVKKFKWVHSGGGRVPRKLHQDLHGKIFSFDDPPYIGDMYGQKVYGLPGHLPNCRCTMSPVLEFEQNDD